MFSEKEIVSIVIPVYNERRYLKDCVNTIVNQTYKNLEIILVDDGSTDGTSDDCDLIALTDKRIKVLHKKNQGLSSARITGLENATGKWIYFVDDDDLISPHAIQILIQQFNSEIDIVTAGRIDIADVNYEWNNPDTVDKVILSGREAVEIIPTDQQKTIITPLWGKIYRLDFLKSIDLYKYKDVCPTIFFEDVLLTPIIFSKARKICVVKEILYLHREVSTSISRLGKLSSFYYEQIDSGKILLEYAKTHNLNNYYKYELKIYINSILRIYMLSDDIHLESYGILIKRNYRLYLKDYIKYSKDGVFHKLALLSFIVSPNIWRNIARKIYFYKKRK